MASAAWRVARAARKRREAIQAKAVADAKAKAAEETAKPAGFLDQARTNAQTLVASLFTAGGFVGMVAFTGTAILWARFYAADLPPDQAVRNLDRSEVIAIGATALIIFAALGAIATLIAYLIEPGGRPSKEMALGLLGVAVAEALVIAALAGKELQQFGFATAVLALSLWLAARLLSDRKYASEKDDLEATAKELALMQDPACREGTDLAERAARPKRLALTSDGRIGLLVIGLGAAVASGLILDEWWVSAATALAFILSRALFGVAQRSGSRFAWIRRRGVLLGIGARICDRIDASAR